VEGAARFGELGEQTAKLRPVGLGAARHFAEYLAGAGLAKLPDLGINTLAVRRDAGITVNRDIGFSDGAKLPGCCTSLNE